MLCIYGLLSLQQLQVGMVCMRPSQEQSRVLTVGLPASYLQLCGIFLARHWFCAV